MYKRREHDRKPPSGLIIGRQPVLEAIRSGATVDRIYLLSTASGENIPEIRRLAREHGIPVNPVPVQKLDSLTRANHQGVVAVAGAVGYTPLQDAIDHVLSKGEAPLFLMLDGVTDVRNIGAIARTALCCGAQAVIIPERGVAALNEDAVKASAGALLQVAVCREPSLLKAVDTLRLNGIQVLSSVMDGDGRLPELDLREPVCIILGSEDKGIQPYLTKASDRRFRIPMPGGFDSLNVGVAAGIILYEAVRQRGGG